MAIGDLYFNFGSTIAGVGQTLSTTPTVSTNVYDAGSAKTVFSGSANDLVIIVTAIGMTAGATLTADFRGATAASLAAGNISLVTGTGVANARGDCVVTLRPGGQTAAKQYYGLFLSVSAGAGTAKAETTIGDAPNNLTVA